MADIKYYRFMNLYYRQSDDMTLMIDTYKNIISPVTPLLQSDIDKNINFAEVTENEFLQKVEIVKNVLGINRPQKLRNQSLPSSLQ